MSWVGQPLARHEDGPLVRGFGRYVGDLAAGASFLRFVRSPFASAAIAGITIPEGVRAFTIDDLAGVAPVRPLLLRPDYVATEQYVLAKDRVRFIGEPIAAVLASSPEQAEDDAERVEVELEPAAAVTDLEAALAPGAVRVHEPAAANTLVEARLQGDGVEAAFAGAAEIVEIAIESGRQSAMPLEARGGHAAFDRRTGRVTLHASVQTPHQLRTGIADCLGIDEALVRVVAPDVGGGFGQKMQTLDRICRGGVAGAPLARRRGLDRGPARESDGLLPQPRPALHAAGRVRHGGPPDRPRRRPALQCRRLLDLSRDLRGRAADGDGRAARSLRFPPLRRAFARRRHPHLPDGALPRRIAPGHHLRDGNG